ncbi:DUF3857 domain-containing protein [uncultured Flavobacterium sp.]|uniref:DUF3857 domain-containing protein n=1 Tax=uncultured Flavobacterium sp. TaxID=165435 RepID=UPI00263A01E5|nr:DUF3857 domain-containing protein [uncultured Flavobacterium sp.]
MKTKLLIFLLFTTFIYSQEYELGKVTIAQLEEKYHPKDTSAVAAILFEKGKTSFNYEEMNGFSTTTEVLVKIKIYKKEGFEWANRKIRHYIDGKKETVSFSKGVTYNLVNGEIEKTKLKSSGEFTEKINNFWSETKIVMPNVKEGSIIEYAYIIKSPFISNFPEWSFQKNIPVNHSEYTTLIPEYFVYNTFTKGFSNIKVTRNSDNRKMPYSYSYVDASRAGTAKSERVTTELQFVENSTNYIAEDVPALKEESFVNNIDNYSSSILHELSMTKYPNSPTKSYSSDWESVVKTIYDNEDFGGQLNKANFYEEDLNALLKDITTTEDKIITIFSYIKNRLNWNGYVGYYSDKGLKKAYQEKTGNTADINLLLVSMLNYAKLNASPILLSTRSNGIPIFPSRNGFNYVIAGVELSNGSVVLLDATNKNAVPNIIPENALNWFGRIVRKNGTSEMVDLYPKKVSLETISILAELKSDGSISGKQRKQLTDYNAFRFRRRHANRNHDDYVQELEKEHNFSAVENYEVTNTNDLSKPIVETYSFSSNSMTDIIDSKIYITPMLFHQMDVNPFKAEERAYPIDFNFPSKDTYNFSIKIPEGYVVESKPETLNLNMNQNMVSFRYSVSENLGTIQLSCVIEVNSPIIESDYYPHLKELFNQIVLKQNEKIVLVKK